MTIYPYNVSLRELSKNYKNDDENGVSAFDGKLDIRPPFQREFIYKDKERDAVIDTITKGFPLNTMYWSKNEDGTYELLDGQQRTLSALKYIYGDFSVNNKFFHNLTNDQKDQILNYEFTIYVCEGTQSEKLDWFRVVNIAGEKLTEQELRNSQYTGPWLYDAKRHFSKSTCVAFQVGGKYLEGSPERQDYLETSLKWICYRDKIQIEEYMARHQHENDANELWMYYQGVIDWVKRLFPTYKKEVMKGVDWGYFYNLYKDENFNSDEFETKVSSLILDGEVTNKKGICPYLITGEEKYLNLRKFDEAQKLAAYERQNGICPICGKPFDYNKMEGDHIVPWHSGGQTTEDNCQMLCQKCNREKSGK